MKKIVFVMIGLMLMSSVCFGGGTTVQRVMSSNKDATAVISTKYMRDLTVIVSASATRTQEATLTMYGSNDDGSVKYLLGIKPFITGTVDGNGAITYTTQEVGTYGYEVVGSHENLFFNYDKNINGTGEAICTIEVVGKDI